MTTDFAGDFARLVPHNHVAQMLFSKTYVSAVTNDTFHLRFMDCSQSQTSRASDEPVEESTEYDTCLDTDSEYSRSKSVPHLGHFVISFNKNRAPEIAHLGWRVGRGTSKSLANRDVDLLLAKPGDILSKSLASIHMLIRFNLRSGLLMLKGGSAKVPVEFKMAGVWEKLGYEEEHLMHQPATLLRAGICEYELEYTIEEKHRDAYFNQRDTFLETISPSVGNFQRNFKKLPGDSSVRRGRYLEFGTQGSGAFGWITQGVDIKTGDPIAVKELRIKSRRNRLEVMAEVKMGRQFYNKRGLVPILDAWCEHSNPNGCCDLERFYIFMPLARSDLTWSFWTRPEISKSNKMAWLREPLEGIKTLHAMGIMHRDIRPKNTLILSLQPPRAALCDYGKAIESRTSTVTTIGPICTLAPEVWTVLTDGPYGVKIDMWAYGYAIAEILGYTIEKYPATDGPHSNNPRITRGRHSAILKMLHAHSVKVTEDELLVDLVLKLLVWEPEKRWTASKALEHECWGPIVGESEDNKEHVVKEGPSRIKRTQLKDPRSDKSIASSI